MKHVQTIVATIFIAGSYSQCKQVLQKYVLKGACVSVKKCDYIYTMGSESGIEITIINYPRFPRTYAEIEIEAQELAQHLIEELYQGSCTLVMPKETFFFTLADCRIYSNENHKRNS